MRRTAHGTVVFRIYRYDIECNQRFDRGAAGDPCNGFISPLGAFGLYVVLHHEVSHGIRGLYPAPLLIRLPLLLALLQSASLQSRIVDHISGRRVSMKACSLVLICPLEKLCSSLSRTREGSPTSSCRRFLRSGISKRWGSQKD